MFHKALTLTFKEKTILEIWFRDGKVKQYDVACLFDKYPQMKALTDRELFLSGKLAGFYGIVWNDELDLECETVYEEGATVSVKRTGPCVSAGEALSAARIGEEMTQKQLAAVSGIDQADISKIERGLANPSLNTLDRLADALGKTLVIRFE